MKLQLYFQNSQELCPITYSLKMLIRAASAETLEAEHFVGYDQVEISVTFADDEGIRAINREYREIDRPTDVLSFPLFDYSGESEEPPVDELVGMLGDIVISLEQAEIQAEEYGHPFEREIAFLTVHSMLHLLGYDHETGEEDELDMRRRQSEIMDILGLSVPQK